ncbi:MAG: flagellar biosynthesis protein FlhA [Burkholderiales bacterium]
MQANRLAVPLLIIMIIAMMVLPLPPIALDLLFTFNIAVSMLVLLVSTYTRHPLEFAVFPTVLLVTTLLRLSLNVASSRAVLLHGHTGPDAAGKVIEAFANFLVGGNFVVGFVVFVILVVINFVVITKGAGRIAEVSARFALDAMPGKQMAIDADLNAGLIEQEEAKRRRLEVAQEADFYGSMDGASKFVRGDAVAGILILFVNIVGGLFIGILQHNLPLAQAANNYVLLSIGDGLVAQVPALIISTAAGLIVSRVGKDQDIGQQLSRQLLSMPQALFVTAGILGLLGIIPGMPHFAFLLLAGGIGGAAWWIGKQQIAQAALAAAEPVPTSAPNADGAEATWDDLVPIDVLGLEVGYRLIPLVDRQQDGEMLKRIKGIRKKFAQEVGFLPPPVHIRDNLELRPNGYRISLKGVTIGEGESHANSLLAINPGNASGTLQGQQTKDPAFGLPAVWIDTDQREGAQLGGYTVVDAATVVATHLHSLIGKSAGRLLGRQEVQALVDHFAKGAPKLIEDVIPKMIPLAILHRVLQNLLDEGVHIRDFRTIIEAVAEQAARTQDAAELTAAVRIALGPAIVQSLYGGVEELQVIVVEPDLEKVLHQAIATSSEVLGIEPTLAEGLLRNAQQLVDRQESIGQPSALLVPDRLRSPLARLLRRSVPQIKVIAHAEIPDTRTIRVSAILGAAA